MYFNTHDVGGDLSGLGTCAACSTSMTAAPASEMEQERQYVVDDFEAELLADLEQTDHQVKGYSSGCPLSSQS